LKLNARHLIDEPRRREVTVNPPGVLQAMNSRQGGPLFLFQRFNQPHEPNMSCVHPCFPDFDHGED
jgi:hypothetical protein